MGTQAGIVNVDGTPVAPDYISLIRRVLNAAGHDYQVWRSDNVCLAYADVGNASSRKPLQPYVSGGHVITFDGRLDNRDELCLPETNTQLDDDCDPALALSIYQHRSLQGLGRLIGDWSLAIWNSTDQEVILGSDFAGVRPLYYSVDGSRVAWSTRLKILLEFRRSRALDDEYVASFFQCGGCPGRTPYKGIFALLPGHCLVASRSRNRLVPFWKPPIDRKIRYKRESEYEEQLRDVFQNALRSRLRSSSPILCELSGGFDSSSIVCMARDLIENEQQNPSRIVTLSYEHKDSLDKPYYTAVEKMCGFANRHLDAEEYRFLTEADTRTELPEFWVQLRTAVADAARQCGARRLLTGTFGDLIMGNWWDDSSQVAGFIRTGAFSSAIAQALEWGKCLRIPVTDILWRSLLVCFPAHLVMSRTNLFCDGSGPRRLIDELLTKTFRARNDQEHSMLSKDWMHAPPERRKHFRAVTETLELRQLQVPEPLMDLSYTHPFAHRPLVEYMLSIPPEIACKPGEPRRLMRRAFGDRWPAPLRRRHSKDSFGGVFLTALRSVIPTLRSKVEELEVVKRGYIEPLPFANELTRLEQSLPYVVQLRYVMLFELWLRQVHV